MRIQMDSRKWNFARIFTRIGFASNFWPCPGVLIHRYSKLVFLQVALNFELELQMNILVADIVTHIVLTIVIHWSLFMV